MALAIFLGYNLQTDVEKKLSLNSRLLAKWIIRFVSASGGGGKKATVYLVAR
jgi:hypothetical protein